MFRLTATYGKQSTIPPLNSENTRELFDPHQSASLPAHNGTAQEAHDRPSVVPRTGAFTTAVVTVVTGSQPSTPATVEVDSLPTQAPTQPTQEGGDTLDVRARGSCRLLLCCQLLSVLAASDPCPLQVDFDFGLLTGGAAEAFATQPVSQER